MRRLGTEEVCLIAGITGRLVSSAYKGVDRWAMVYYADGCGEEPRWVDYVSHETRNCCQAASPDGWQCEQMGGHDRKHRAGEVEWDGTTRRLETENRVLSLLCQEVSGVTVIFLAERLNLSAATVRRHLHKLRDEDMALVDTNHWPQQWCA